MTVSEDPTRWVDEWAIPGLSVKHRTQIKSQLLKAHAAFHRTAQDVYDSVYRFSTEGEARYSPAEVASVEVVPVLGNPDPKRICTSIVERQNLTIRMQMRRLTRLTNGFSKKWESLWAAYCLHFAYYNFCRIHSSLRVTPAMEAKLTDHVWELAELLA